MIFGAANVPITVGATYIVEGPDADLWGAAVNGFVGGTAGGAIGIGLGSAANRIATAAAARAAAKTAEKEAAEIAAKNAADLETAVSNLRSIPDGDGMLFEPNAAMVNSVRDAISAGRPLSKAEQNFLDHEVLEAQYIHNGMSQVDAHIKVYETIPAASNYSPEVILRYPDQFGSYYFKYWGITRP